MRESLYLSYEHPDVKEADMLLAHGREYERLLNDAQVLLKGELRDVAPETTGIYSNSVILTEVQLPQEMSEVMKASNQFRLFSCDIGDGEKIYSVFKPETGVRPARKKEFEIATNFYTREITASIIDSVMGLGIVPPTVEKVIDGDVGSLQLYIPPAVAASREHVTNADQIYKASSPDWKKMALLDILINNADRNQFNYLVYRQDPSRLVAIDHGISFCGVRPYDENVAVRAFRNNQSASALDDTFQNYLTSLLNNRKEIITKLPEEILDLMGLPRYDIFNKASRMLEAKSLLFDWGQK